MSSAIGVAGDVLEGVGGRDVLPALPDHRRELDLDVRERARGVEDQWLARADEAVEEAGEHVRLLRDGPVLLGEVALRVRGEAVDLRAVRHGGEEPDPLLGLEQEPGPGRGPGGPAGAASALDVLEDLLGDLDRLGPAREERPHVAEPARVGALDRIDAEVVPARRVEVDVLVRVGDHPEMELVGEHEVDELHAADSGPAGWAAPDKGRAGAPPRVGT